ncbi:MAG: Zn-dependent membrane protease YugP [Planctomycetota bacterium]|jgi:Zn-dependent membrane protease YugP
MFFGLDSYYLIAMGLGLLLSLIASARVKSAFNKYAKIGVQSGMTGAEAALAVARAGGVTDITVERHQGFLSDHYDPRSKTLRLSPEVHDGRSISSIAVAAHEAGHSIQDVEAYAPLAYRSFLVPITNFGSRFWIWPIILGGMFARGDTMFMNIGIVLFSTVVLFQLVTLPVEFNATKRAKQVLAKTGIVSTQEEAVGVSKVLDAAAMTYVASALGSIMQLIALVLRARDRG